MAYEDITALLGGWPGFDIQTVRREPGGTHSGAPQIAIDLVARSDAPRYCSRCGHTTYNVHDVTPRRICERDMSEAFKKETHAHCPQVLIVYDLFYVVANSCAKSSTGCGWT